MGVGRDTGRAVLVGVTASGAGPDCFFCRRDATPVAVKMWTDAPVEMAAELIKPKLTYIKHRLTDLCGNGLL